MRIVLDTGIFVSALITKNTPPDLLYSAWREGYFDLVTSEPQLKEIERVFLYPKLQKYINRNEAHFLLDTLNAFAEIVESIPYVGYSSDPDDNKIIATAITGRATILVSGDKNDILSLKEVDGIRFLSARETVQVLNISEQ